MWHKCCEGIWHAISFCFKLVQKNRVGPVLAGSDQTTTCVVLSQSWMYIVHVYNNDPRLCASMSSPWKGRICLSLWLEPVSTKTEHLALSFSLYKNREEYILLLWCILHLIHELNYWCEFFRNLLMWIFYVYQLVCRRNRKNHCAPNWGVSDKKDTKVNRKWCHMSTFRIWQKFQPFLK